MSYVVIDDGKKRKKEKKNYFLSFLKEDARVQRRCLGIVSATHAYSND